MGGPRDPGSTPFISILGLPGPLAGWVCSHLSASPTLSGGPAPLPPPVARRGPGTAGLCSQPPSSILTPGSASPWASSSVRLSSLVHFSPSRRSLPSLSPELSLPLVFEASSLPSTALSVSPHLLSLPASLPSLPISVFLRPVSRALPARVGPGGSWTAWPGRRDEQCPIHAARRRHGNAPAPPSPRAGRACQEDAMVTSGACPPRAPPPRALLRWPGQQGAPGRSLCLESGGTVLPRAFRDSVPQFPVL